MKLKKMYSLIQWSIFIFKYFKTRSKTKTLLNFIYMMWVFMLNFVNKI